VASPRRKKLDEGVLTAVLDLGIKVRLGELDRAGTRAGHEGGRDEASLVEFAKTLGPGCSASKLENCSEEQKAELDTLMKLPEAELEAKLKELKEAVADKEKAHEKLVEGLQASYEASQKELDEFKKASSPKMKMLRAAMPVKDASAAKDEM